MLNYPSTLETNRNGLGFWSSLWSKTNIVEYIEQERQWWNASGILLVEVSNDIAEGPAELRAKYNLKTPDAIQVATALEHQADYFFTNDYRLAVIQEITIVTLADL